MDKWFILSCISACISAMWSLSVKYGLEYYTPTSFASWYSLTASVLVAIYVYIKTKTLEITKLGIWSGIGGGLAGVLLAKSFAISPNPGFSMAIFRMQAILTAIASYIFYGAPLSSSNVLGMIVAILGVVVLSTSDITKTHAKKKNDEKKTQQSNNSKKNKYSAEGYEWILLALGAGVAMTCKDIFTKTGLTQKGPDIMHKLFWSTSFIQTIVLFIILFVSTHSIEPQQLSNKPSNTKTMSIRIVLAGLAFAMYQFSIISATKAAPNVGLVKSN